MAETKPKKTETNPKIKWCNKQQLLSTFLHISTIIIGVYIAFEMSQKPSDKTPPHSETQIASEKKPIYWDFYLPNRGHSLENVHTVLKSVGLEHGSNDSEWDLLWAFDFPFPNLDPYIINLKQHQLVNQIPGSQYITNKATLCSMVSRFIPKSFRFPWNKYEFKIYAERNPGKKFISKNIHHHDLKLVDVEDINYEDTNSFVQEYMEKPHLIDGYKYDVGIYIIITSIDPIRVYYYKGDALYRFCLKKYDSKDFVDMDKHLISDDKLKPDDIASLVKITSAGYSVKSAVENYIRKEGKDPSIILRQVEEFIVDLYHHKRPHMLEEVKKYSSQSNFFQILRLDAIFDTKLKMDVMEITFSPNLLGKERIFYKQIIFNALSLVGIGRQVKTPSFKINDLDTIEMQVSDKNILVLTEQCTGDECITSCEGMCALCIHCLGTKQKADLAKAYKEHMNKQDCQRLFPPSMVQGGELEPPEIENLSPTDKLMYMWYQAKCNEDVSFCS